MPGTDPSPVETRHEAATAPILLVCDHAGREVPRKLGDLGLSGSDLQRHIAYDIGAEAVAKSLADRLSATLVLQRYSRLVIDCNRPPGSKTSIPVVSDSVLIPGNADLTEFMRSQRERAIFEPFAQRCLQAIARPNIRFAVSIHSFTPFMNGQHRPWDIGFLYRDPLSCGDKLVERARDLLSDLSVARNEPYRIEDETDWFIPVCAEPRGIPHCLIEIRNDHLLSEEGQNLWADRLSDLLSSFMEQCDGTHP